MISSLSYLVYNWTTDDVVNWLVNYAHLPMYVENFRRNQFDGRMIPRFAEELTICIDFSSIRVFINSYADWLPTKNIIFLLLCKYVI